MSAYMSISENALRSLANLEERLQIEPYRVGGDVLILMEDWLRERARSMGWSKPKHTGGFSDYIKHLRGNDDLTPRFLDQLDTYRTLRNCLVHNAGLAVAPEKAKDLISFAERLFKVTATTAKDLMTRKPVCVQESDNLVDARDAMLKGNYSQLPVLRQGERLLGMLTERDLVLAQRSGDFNRKASNMLVGDALPANALDQLIVVCPETLCGEVCRHLSEQNVPAVLVTKRGSKSESPLGIVTRADLLCLI